MIVDLYPFEETVASGADVEAIIEKIDIGGISLIRGAAKNFRDVVIIASKAQYKPFMHLLDEKGSENDGDDPVKSIRFRRIERIRELLAETEL